jgi:diguanylate cyclase (GGDEF)-like protein
VKSIRVSATRRIAVVDDDPIVLLAEQELLEREGHQVRTAEGIREGIELIREFEPELVLLDYMLPGGSGADVVRAIREFNDLTQVILVSGLIGEDPVRKLLAELDIQGFHYKQDGNHRLLVHVDAVLKHAQVLSGLQRQQHYLRRILEASPDLSRLGPVSELFENALEHAIRLVRGTSHSSQTVSGLVVLKLGDELSIQAASGDFASLRDAADLAERELRTLKDALGASDPQAHDGLTTIPFNTHSGELGCILVRAVDLPADAIEPCKVFVSQMAQALENIRLYRRATVDPLTEVYCRDFGHKRLEEALALGSRNDHETSLVMLDVDHFKALNDTHGHAAGDVALRAIARAISDACRSTDVVSRYGGEEFAIALPSTSEAGARTIAERVLCAIRQLEIRFDGRQLPVTASAGVTVAAPGELRADDLLRRADLALYRAKAAGRDCVRTEPALRTPLPSAAAG